jgi:hypothetical protein
MALMPTERMAPPPGASPPMRMTASWSGSKRSYRIQVCSTKMHPMASSPRILNRPTDRHRPDAEVMQKAPVAVHHRSACSGVISNPCSLAPDSIVSAVLAPSVAAHLHPYSAPLCTPLATAPTRGAPLPTFMIRRIAVKRGRLGRAARPKYALETQRAH